MFSKNGSMESKVNDMKCTQVNETTFFSITKNNKM